MGHSASRKGGLALGGGRERQRGRQGAARGQQRSSLRPRLGFKPTSIVAAAPTLSFTSTRLLSRRSQASCFTALMPSSAGRMGCAAVGSSAGKQQRRQEWGRMGAGRQPAAGPCWCMLSSPFKWRGLCAGLPWVEQPAAAQARRPNRVTDERRSRNKFRVAQGGMDTQTWHQAALHSRARAAPVRVDMVISVCSASLGPSSVPPEEILRASVAISSISARSAAARRAEWWRAAVVDGGRPSGGGKGGARDWARQAAASSC